MKNKTALAVIPARGGSKGLPGKNIRQICGKPLIAWTIEQALNCRFFDAVHVSTDSPEIAAVSANYGVPVLELRPANLATDTATSVDVLFHALERFKEKGRHFDYVALLEPTSPLRKPDDLERALATAFAHEEADGVISLGEVHTEHPAIIKSVNAAGYLEPYAPHLTANVTRRQELGAAYFPYGVIYLIKTSVLETEKRIYTEKMLPHYIERWQNYEVDDLCDLMCIEAILKMQLRGEI